MALTDTAIKALKPEGKLYRKTDDDGLAIEVAVSGAKLWRYRYRFNGTSKMVGLGEYPTITLSKARKLRDHAKELLSGGIDPAEQRRQLKVEAVQAQEAEAIAAYSFQQAFDDWHAFKSSSWSDGYADDVTARARMYLLPRLGKKALTTITPPDVLATLKDCESGGKLDTLKKVRSILSQVFRFAVGMGRLTSDPSRDVSADVFQQPPKKNLAHQTDPAMIRGIYQTVTENACTKCWLKTPVLSAKSSLRYLCRSTDTA
jgi:hypothetical protein